MNLTAEQIQIASMIDTKVQALSGAGCDDATVLGEMLDYMPGFKRLMDTSHGRDGRAVPALSVVLPLRQILESVAARIQSGSIKVPK